MYPVSSGLPQKHISKNIKTNTLKKHYSKKIKLLKLKRSLKLIRKSVRKAFFKVKFDHENVDRLHTFISKNGREIKYASIDGLLMEFIKIIKKFTEKDVQYFFDTIHLWNSYHLVIIADKLLDTNVRAHVKYDFGILYCKIFCLYEKFDSYYLIDNLEIAVNMYHSKLDVLLLEELTGKIQFLFQNRQITGQQLQHSLLFIEQCKNRSEDENNK